MGIAEESQTKLKAGDDAAEAEWFDINELPENMAFDHNEMVNFAVGRLKNEQ
jgi:8-oxo-dGTP diphosphatase